MRLSNTEEQKFDFTSTPMPKSKEMNRKKRMP